MKVDGELIISRSSLIITRECALKDICSSNERKKKGTKDKASSGSRGGASEERLPTNLFNIAFFFIAHKLDGASFFGLKHQSSHLATMSTE